MITIVNKHHGRSGIYVGRPTVLGNPYTLQVSSRTDAIARYRIWLRQQWQRHGEVQAALLQLARQYQEQGTSRSRVGAHHSAATRRWCRRPCSALCSTGWWRARLHTRPRPQDHLAHQEAS